MSKFPLIKILKELLNGKDHFQRSGQKNPAGLGILMPKVHLTKYQSEIPLKFFERSEHIFKLFISNLLVTYGTL